MWPNGLAFSCRERCIGSRQNSEDLAREAVSCNAGLDGGLKAGLEWRLARFDKGTLYADTQRLVCLVTGAIESIERVVRLL